MIEGMRRSSGLYRFLRHEQPNEGRPRRSRGANNALGSALLTSVGHPSTLMAGSLRPPAFSLGSFALEGGLN